MTAAVWAACVALAQHRVTGVAVTRPLLLVYGYAAVAVVGAGLAIVWLTDTPTEGPP